MIGVIMCQPIELKGRAARPEECAMDCPVCKKPLIVLEYDEVEVDYCVECNGIWLDSGEIELLYGDAAECRELLAGGAPGESDHREKKRRCPICDKKMIKTASGGPTPVTYDRCPDGDGLWFDEGELIEILKHGDAFAESEIGAFLGNVFADGPESGSENGETKQ